MTVSAQIGLFGLPSLEELAAEAASFVVDQADTFIDGPWTATVHAPPGVEWMTANKRYHWAQRARLTRPWRAAGLAAAQAANLPLDLERIHLAVVVHLPRRSRIRDAENLRPTVKAAIDGLVGDYGLCADDSDRHLEGTDLRRGAKETHPAEPGRLVFTITRRDPQP